ncbi:unnamed protein product [Linum trigynum]
MDPGGLQEPTEMEMVDWRVSGRRGKSRRAEVVAAGAGGRRVGSQEGRRGSRGRREKALVGLRRWFGRLDWRVLTAGVE